MQQSKRIKIVEISNFLNQKNFITVTKSHYNQSKMKQSVCGGNNARCIFVLFYTIIFSLFQTNSKKLSKDNRKKRLHLKYYGEAFM